MATQADVRLIAATLPDTSEGRDQFSFSVRNGAKDKGFFTEPHYNGFPAVLVRLPKVGKAELQELLVDAWRCQAPKRLVAEFDART